MSPREQELHDHYARNAKACEHTDECNKVKKDINWPTIMGRVECTCESGQARIAMLARR